MLDFTPTEIVFPLGSDLSQEGKELGPDTVAALAAAARTFKRLVAQGRAPVIILSAGIHTGINKKQTRDMSDMMREWLEIQDVQQSCICIAAPCWTTAKETAAAVRLARSVAGPPRIIVIGKWWHMRRIRWTIKVIAGGEKSPVAQLSLAVAAYVDHNRRITESTEGGLLFEFVETGSRRGYLNSLDPWKELFFGGIIKNICRFWLRGLPDARPPG